MENGVDFRHVDFLNSIKERAVIDNAGRYTSTASHPNNALDYSITFGQSYTLKINVPKGIKILDMQHCSYRKIDEFVLPIDSKYKIINIDYKTGIVECELIF